MLKLQPKVFIQAFVSLCVLAFGALAFYEYYTAQKEKEKQEELALFLPHTELKQLKAFQIEQSNDQLSAVQKEKEWFLIKPVEDLLDWTELSRWFDSIKSQKVQKISTENIDWKDYYLDSAPSVQLALVGGEKIIFSVSKKSSFDGRYFIKKSGELFIGESDFFSEVNEKDLGSFRSKKILPGLNHANQIQFKGRYNFQLNWRDYKWSLEGASPGSLPLDSSRLDGFWTDLSSLKALSIKEAVQPSSLRNYQLNKPQQIINLVYGDKKYTLKLSFLKGEKAFVVVSHRNYIFEISKEQADKLLLPKNDIYNHNFPFHYKAGLAVHVEKRAGKSGFAIKKEGESWKSAEGRTVDSEKVKDLLDQIKELRGENYKKGIDSKPLRSFVIKDSESQLLFELQEISQSKNSSWVKTNLWPERIAVSKSEIDGIFNQDIFVKKDDKSDSVKTE